MQVQGHGRAADRAKACVSHSPSHLRALYEPRSATEDPVLARTMQVWYAAIDGFACGRGAEWRGLPRPPAPGDPPSRPAAPRFTGDTGTEAGSEAWREGWRPWMCRMGADAAV